MGARTMACSRGSRIAALALVLGGAAAMLSYVPMAYAGDDSAPTNEQCEAMPHETELEKLEHFRCATLYVIHHMAFRGGERNLRLWKSPMKIYSAGGDERTARIISRYASSLNNSGNVSLSIVDKKRDANVFIFFSDENTGIDAEEMRSILRIFFNERSCDIIIKEIKDAGGSASMFPYARRNDEMASCVLHVNTSENDDTLEKKIGMTMYLCTISGRSADHYVRIFNTSSLYDDVEWMDDQILNIIYSSLRPGMPWSEAKMIINRVFDNNRERMIREGHR